MQFEFVENNLKHKIRVIGIGGAGNNAVNNMIDSGLEGVAFIVANTDLQDLEHSPARVKLQLGAELTKGLGCGADPGVGREAALEDEEKIKDLLEDSDMVFVTAGMGGGTGTGGAPVVAECMKKLKNPPLTVAVVTKPFAFEGPRRMRQAEEGILMLEEFADTIITIPNDRLMAMAPRGCSLKDAFKMADDVLLQAVKGGFGSYSAARFYQRGFSRRPEGHVQPGSRPDGHRGGRRSRPGHHRGPGGHCQPPFGGYFHRRGPGAADQHFLR